MASSFVAEALAVSGKFNTSVHQASPENLVGLIRRIRGSGVKKN